MRNACAAQHVLHVHMHIVQRGVRAQVGAERVAVTSHKLQVTIYKLHVTSYRWGQSALRLTLSLVACNV